MYNKIEVDPNRIARGCLGGATSQPKSDMQVVQIEQFSGQSVASLHVNRPLSLNSSANVQLHPPKERSPPVISQERDKSQSHKLSYVSHASISKSSIGSYSESPLYTSSLVTTISSSSAWFSEVLPS